MKKELLATRKGFSLIEVILSVTLFAMLVTTFIGAALYGQESTVLAGQRSRAAFIANEGLEAVRNIREENFGSLVDGTYGLAIIANKWTLSGSNDVVDNFTREVVISPVDGDRKQVTVNVSWSQNKQRNGELSLVSYFTNWLDKVAAPTCLNQSDFLTIDSSGANLTQGNILLRGVLLGNSTTTCNITIDKVTVFWTNASRSIVDVFIPTNSNVWTGLESTGTQLDVTDVTVEEADGQFDTRYRFDGNMSGNIFNITYTMGDETIKTETGIAP